MLTERNAVIKSAHINDGERGLLTAWLDLDYGGSGQGFGGYALFLPGDYTHSKQQANYAGLFIWRVMQVAGVSSWHQLEGKTIRVRQEHGKVHAIGHIVKDDWFDPSVEFKRLDSEFAE